MAVTDLDEASRLIRGLISDPTAKVSVVVETGPDEAAAIGTSNAYLRLALAALEFVQQTRRKQVEQRMVGSHNLACTTSFGDVFSGPEYRITAGWMAESELEAKAVADYFENLSPPSR